ncbi:hypothetical protein DFS34DRAFT_670175 [Phlyctochytrium arcticum]|nr:hypothetical protein DFS34DRAFT_670175 [Phlyctochytrium arcticum]
MYLSSCLPAFFRALVLAARAVGPVRSLHALISRTRYSLWSSLANTRSPTPKCERPGTTSHSSVINLGKLGSGVLLISDLCSFSVAMCRRLLKTVILCTMEGVSSYTCKGAEHWTVYIGLTQNPTMKNKERRASLETFLRSRSLPELLLLSRSEQHGANGAF